MELSTTTKGKECALYEGYCYYFKRKNEDGVISWRCSKVNSKKCFGAIKSRDGEVLSETDHQCGAPDVARLEVKKTVQKAKKRARDEDTSISKIYNEELGELHNKGYEFVTEMPSQRAAKRDLHRQRYKSQGNQTEPETREDIILDKEILKMKDGSSFLLADDNAGERILVFCGNRGREGLKFQKEFFMDGTFKSSSKQFSQIYSIHADFVSSPEETNVYPVAFALLPNKKKETYIRLFQIIREVIPSWSPRTVNVDFEIAAISALKEVFPLVVVKGCYFHMKKCLWRRVQEVGLTRDYKDNDQVRLHIQMCAALAFLKPEDVSDGWLEIYSQAPENAKLTEFFDYFIETWLENDDYPIELWNCHNRRHRTTNAVEGWNNRLNNTLRKTNPRIKELISCLKSEAENAARAYMTLQLNLGGKRRKSTYIRLDEGINKTFKTYEQNGDIRTFLLTMSYLQKLD